MYEEEARRKRELATTQKLAETEHARAEAQRLAAEPGRRQRRGHCSVGRKIADHAILTAGRCCVPGWTIRSKF